MFFSYSPTDVGLPDVSNKLSNNGSATKLLLGVAALALGQALQDGNGTLTFHAIVWLTIALICAGASVASHRLSFPQVSNKILWVVLVTGLIWQIFQLLTTLPGIYILPAELQKLWRFQACVVFGGICALLSLAPRTWFSLRARRGLIGLVFIAVLVASIWVIRATPNPHIDVFMFQQTSSAALKQGQNPYEQTPPNIYGNMEFYGAALVINGNMTIGNPYPPLSIYFSFLGYVLTGDIRYSYLAAILLAGLLMACLRPGRTALLAVYILLFTPRLYFVLEQSWIEPLVLLLAVAVVWCAIHRPAWIFVVLGLLVASKQYMIFLSPLIILLIPLKSSRRVWTQAGGWTVGVAFAVTAPLAFWNFPAFLWDVGLVQFYQISRLEALSYAAMYARMFGQFPSQYIPFVVLGAVLLIMWHYGARSPAGFAIAMALCLGLFFAFSKQAFCNYYFLVVGILCCALAALPASDNLFISDRKTNCYRSKNHLSHYTRSDESHPGNATGFAGSTTFTARQGDPMGWQILVATERKWKYYQPGW